MRKPEGTKTAVFLPSGVLRCAFVGLGLLLCASGLSAEADIPSRAYAWLCRQQQASGLLGNQEADDFAGLYPNALAAICFVHEGDTDRARRVLSFYNDRFAAEFAHGTPGGFHQFANARTGRIDADSDRWVGDNAWLLIALNYYRAQSGRDDFDAMQEGIARWIISLQEPQSGGVRAGYNRQGAMAVLSTEANLDCYAALADYPQQQQRVREWLETRMWVGPEKRFRMGSTVDETAMDCVAWAVCSLGPEYARALPYGQQHFARTDKSVANGASVAGFADLLKKSRIWLEGTGQMVVAFEVAGQKDQAQRYLAELQRAMIPSSAFPGLSGLPCSTSDPNWAGASTRIFVPSQAWYLFGAWGFNPMAEPEKPGQPKPAAAASQPVRNQP